MVVGILRAAFIILTVAAAALYGSKVFVESLGGYVLTIGAAVGVSLLIVLVDMFSPKKSLSAVAGLFLGLIVGMLAAYAMSFLVDYAQLLWKFNPEMAEGIKLLIGLICVFVATTLIVQTKDDFRFLIPYVEFAKQIRGTRPMLLDTSAIIDGRMVDVVQTQLVHGPFITPKFVVDELHTISDSADRLKRARGRRGLDILAKLQDNPLVDMTIDETQIEGAGVDQKLIVLAEQMRGRIVTTDYNLAKVAQLRHVDVINVNDLANALRPVVLPGERMMVKIVKPGESAGQGVGYLEDGTMVVVESAGAQVGEDVDATVTSVLQTSVGRMIFGRLEGQGASDDRRNARPKA